jgi:anti-sigma factor RsiW
MKTSISSADNLHQKVVLLLPWYVNQSLERHESRLVDAHLQHCMSCRRELSSLRLLSAAIQRNSSMNAAVDLSFAALKSRLPVNQQLQQRDASIKFAGTAKINKSIGVPISRGWRHLARATIQWFQHINMDGMSVRHAVTAALLILMIPASILFRSFITSNEFNTLSASKPQSSASGQIRVVFAPTLTEAGIDRLLYQIHGQRLSVPNSVGAYTITLTPSTNQELANVIAFLRSQPNVLLAEPVTTP